MTHHDALLLVDLQYDFMPGGALAVHEGDAVVPVANALASRFGFVVATQDWHPADHGSFDVANPGLGVGDHTTLGGLDQIVWPVHCVQGSHGAELHADLDPSQLDAVVQKGTDPGIDSYSGFFDNGHRKATGLEGLLRRHGVARVFVMGLATDYCVKYTVLDALELGFATVVVEDGCRAVDLSPGDGRRALDAMRAAGATVARSVEVAPA